MRPSPDCAYCVEYVRHDFDRQQAGAGQVAAGTGKRLARGAAQRGVDRLGAGRHLLHHRAVAPAKDKVQMGCVQRLSGSPERGDGIAALPALGCLHVEAQLRLHT